MAGYKPVAIQAFPVLGEKITQDTLYWNNYKVSIYASFSSLCYTLDTLVRQPITKNNHQQLIVWAENLISDIFSRNFI